MLTRRFMFSFLVSYPIQHCSVEGAGSVRSSAVETRDMGSHAQTARAPVLTNAYFSG